jgi:peptidoglycan/xylan/chitin deacetylase (PgdA/CDA1 family)
VTRRVWLSILIALLVTGAGIAAVELTQPGAKSAAAHRGSLAEGPLTPGKPRSRSTTTTTTVVLDAAPTPTPIPLPPSALAPVISRVPTTDRVIFLGIDDGLVRDPQVLELLRSAKLPFTAFLVRGPAQQGLGFWHLAQQAGGTIESHTITHPKLTKLGPAAQRREICGTLDDYQAWFGRRPTLFRPPYGFYNDNVRRIAAECGYRAIVMWKAATNDGRLDIQEGTLKPGDILLMHWRTDLAENLQVVIARAKAQRFSIGRLEDYLSPGA